jgi:hypothetical protein
VIDIDFLVFVLKMKLVDVQMWLNISYSSGSDVSHQFEFATFFDALYCSKLQISNRPDTNHVSVVQLSGHLAGIVIGVVAITSTIALATQLILRGRWFRRHGYPTARAFCDQKRKAQRIRQQMRCLPQT